MSSLLDTAPGAIQASGEGCAVSAGAEVASADAADSARHALPARGRRDVVRDPGCASPAGDTIPARDLEHERLGMLALAMGAAAEAGDYATLRDDALLSVAGVLAQEAAIVAAQQAMVAGELARRSRPELGVAGLARSRGHRTAVELVRVATGMPVRQATTAVEVGVMLVAADEAAEPWLAAVGDAVVRQGLPVEKASAIRRGLGSPSEGAGEMLLAGAAARLLAEAPTTDADRLLARARELRDELDEGGVRERHRREQRSFRLYRQPDGMTRAHWLMDPETAAIVTDVVDRATSPKLGGPRFVDARRAEQAAQVAADPRTPEQLASDVLVDLLRAGHAADPGLLVGVGAPAVRVLVTRDDLAAGRGVVAIEGQSAPVSVATAERIACGAGVQEVGFDDRGRPLDVGRTQRLFTPRQRLALAARDGGCRFPGCERPPSWTEAHHVRHWLRDRGGTDIGNGILLCRHHHLLVHDAGWEIRERPGPPGGTARDRAVRDDTARNNAVCDNSPRDNSQREDPPRGDAAPDSGVVFEFIPPPSLDSARTPRVSPSRSSAYRRLLASGA